jgi:hypothetical protein
MNNKVYEIPKQSSVLVRENGIVEVVGFLRDEESYDDYFEDYKREKEDLVMDKYFSDIHNLFLGNLAKFVASADVLGSEIAKLRSLLEEMIRVKILIAGSSGK